MYDPHEAALISKQIYAGSSLIGSPSAMYELLQAAAVRAPVDGNAGGSYLTMRSKSGLIFG